MSELYVNDTVSTTMSEGVTETVVFEDLDSSLFCYSQRLRPYKINFTIIIPLGRLYNQIILVGVATNLRVDHPAGVDLCATDTLGNIAIAIRSPACLLRLLVQLATVSSRRGVFGFL